MGDPRTVPLVPPEEITPFTMASWPGFLDTMVRITDPERSRAFYEALGFTFAGEFDIVRDGQLEATNYFFSMGDQESVLELTSNHEGRSYELGTGIRPHCRRRRRPRRNALGARGSGNRAGTPA